MRSGLVRYETQILSHCQESNGGKGPSFAHGFLRMTDNLHPITIHPAAAQPGKFFPGILLLFVGSGCAALIYEVVWLQLLQLVIGLTTASLGLLLGTFMGGMCLGSMLLPRCVPRHWHPLRVYAVLELGIAALGILMLFAVPWVSQLYTAHAGRGITGVLLRGVVAALCLLPPTLLMGATLPAIARWVQSSREGVAWLGFFYGGNIAGAVVGCLLAGFYLLRVYDMATATYVAAAINVAVAMAGLVASRGPSCQPDSTGFQSTDASDLAAAGGSTAQSNDSRKTQPFGRSSWPVYGAIGLSGMSALGAEVVWTRLLSLMLGATVYTFSIILAVFLFGLGIGSSIGSFLARSTVSARSALASCQMLLVAAAGWAAYMIAQSLPYWPINPSLGQNPWISFQMDLARCLWAVLPAAILWGASFPLALAAIETPAADPGRLVGRVYAANTIGAILGAILFSIWIIPTAGTHFAERLLIGIPAAAAVLVCWPWGIFRSKKQPAVFLQPPSPQVSMSGRLALAVRLAAAVICAAVLIWGLAPAPWGLIAYGRFMATYGSRLAPGVRPEAEVPAGSDSPDIFATFVGEGLNGSVAVTQWSSGVRNFHSAGKVQASNDPRDMRLQRMLGHLSALAHQKPESVLVVACGAGVTAGTFVLHPEVKRIVICDIEPLVPAKVAPMFEKENYGVVQDQRTEIVVDDGRHFIRTTQEKFDIITSDPIDPWVKGCAALNTVEYYQMCKDHLKPGGVMSLWIPLYENNSDSAKSLIATFFKVFPNGILWSNDNDGEGYDAVLFGQVEPTRIDVDQMQLRMNRPDHLKVKESLADVGFHSAVGLLSTYAGRASDMEGWMRDAQINRDRNLRLQYLAGFWLNSNMGSEILLDISRFYKFPDNLFAGSEVRIRMLKAAHRSPVAKQSREEVFTRGAN